VTKLVSLRQIKVARSLLSWTSSTLAEKSEVGLMTIRRYESADGIPDRRVAQLMKIKSALEAVGIEFIGDLVSSPGGQLKPKA